MVRHTHRRHHQVSNELLWQWDEHKQQKIWIDWWLSCGFVVAIHLRTFDIYEYLFAQSQKLIQIELLTHLSSSLFGVLSFSASPIRLFISVLVLILCERWACKIRNSNSNISNEQRRRETERHSRGSSSSSNGSNNSNDDRNEKAVAAADSTRFSSYKIKFAQ